MKTSPYRQEHIEACFDPDVLEVMWAEVPDAFRLTRYRHDTVPAANASSFGLRPATAARDTSDVIKLDRLPDTIAREVGWAIWRMVVDQGRKMNSLFDTMLLRVADIVDRPPSRRGPIRSLVDLSLAEWEREISKAHVRRGCVVAAVRPHLAAFRVVHELVSLRYDKREWWRRDVWNPAVDKRIPLREHEPNGHHLVSFLPITHDWLREAAKWHCKVSLETGQLTWSSVMARVVSLQDFDAYLRTAGIDVPWLADGVSGPRAVMLDYLGHLRQQKRQTGARKGQPLSNGFVAHKLTDIEVFYNWMATERETAALVLGRHWLKLDTRHFRFFRFGEKPRHASQAVMERRVAEQVIDEEALSLILENAELIAKPIEEGGLGDPQAMNILLLLAFTGRRINEILMLDFDPLLPLGWGTGGDKDKDKDWFVAKLRYQQTKIAQGTDTIPVEAEVVAIIKAQQRWAQQFMADLTGLPDQPPPRYLFLARRRNHNGARHYPAGSISAIFNNYVAKIDVRDQADHLIDISRTHRFRHTRATTLINRGVQLPVLMRYMGHAFPSMTLHYAHIAASTEEQAFVRFQKVTSDGRPLDIDPRDLYDMMQLMADADRMLPNGVCLLPPKMACDRGNACLTCPKFATDRAYYDAHTNHLHAIDELIEQRQAEFLARHGAPMSEDNVWLAGRRQERAALQAVLASLEAQSADDERAIRGAGAGAKLEQPVTLDLDRHRRTA